MTDKEKKSKKKTSKEKRQARKNIAKAKGATLSKKLVPKQLKSADFVLVVLTLALVVFGVIMVFSASYYWSIDKNGNPYTFLLKDIFWALTGFALMLGAMSFDYHKYKKAATPLLLFGIALLIAVLFVGANINGATRWISIFGLTIMPGEIIKICLIIFTASWLGYDAKKANKIVSGVLPLLAITMGCVVLILKQPNMSTAITVFGIVFAMLFVAGLKTRYVVSILGIGFVGALAYIISGGGYRLKRLTSFLNPFADPLGDGYQVVQGMLALGTGGLFGLGLGKSVQKNLYLPEPQNDFILAIIGEELGYISVLILMMVYMFLIWRGIKIVLDAPDLFGMLLGSGIVMMIGIQVVLNVAVVTSSMPPTGITLPFISYGGNALWLFMGSMGILLNISRQSGKKKAEEPQEKELSQDFEPRTVKRTSAYKDGQDKIRIK